jgi:hypothetical protein
MVYIGRVQSEQYVRLENKKWSFGGGDAQVQVEQKVKESS